MKKRLRKKLRLQEFQEVGFSLKYGLDSARTEAEHDLFWYKLLGVAKANRLVIGGGTNGFFATADSHRSTTETDRGAIYSWLQQQPEVINFTIGPLGTWHESSEASAHQP